MMGFYSGALEEPRIEFLGHRTATCLECASERAYSLLIGSGSSEQWHERCWQQVVLFIRAFTCLAWLRRAAAAAAAVAGISDLIFLKGGGEERAYPQVPPLATRQCSETL